MQDFWCLVHDERGEVHRIGLSRAFRGDWVRCVIIGNGVAALEAAVAFRKLDPDSELRVISDESELPFSRPALMYVFMGQVRFKDTLLYDPSRLEQLNLKSMKDRVVGIETEEKTLLLHSGKTLSYDRLLIATGSTPRKIRFEGEDDLFKLENVCGFYHLDDLKKLDALSRHSKRVVITGGGLIGVEVAEMLQSRGLSVDFVVRETDYWRSQLPAWESRRLSERIRRHGIKLYCGDEVASVKREGQHVVEVRTKNGLELPSDIFVMSIGVEPNIAFLRESALETQEGVVVDQGLRTSLPDVYAAGDCAELRGASGETRVEKVWYTAKAQGRIAGANLAGGERSYQAHLWFNSAKFFDQEYQIYGEVPVSDRQGDRHFLAEVGKGDVLFRIVERDGRMIGMSSLGLRLRHRKAEQFIETHESWASMRLKLQELLFEPEFSHHTFEFVETTAEALPPEAKGDE